MKTLSCQNPDL